MAHSGPVRQVLSAKLTVALDLVAAPAYPLSDCESHAEVIDVSSGATLDAAATFVG